MLEFVVIVESGADAETATTLAERVLVEEIERLDVEQLPHLCHWCGLQQNTNFSCWKDIAHIVKQTTRYRPPRFIGHRRGESLKADGATSIKIFNLIVYLRQKEDREIKAVLLIRDLDNQPERREGMEQARAQYSGRQPALKIVIGTADRMREAWVLNGFVPNDSTEEERLEAIRSQLNFDPCVEAHRLRSISAAEPDRFKNPKVVLRELTGGNNLREKRCWEETPLAQLRERGQDTGLTAYLEEVEQRLVPLIGYRREH
jgi:hypothetical protein